jgi:hypothetical protein
MTVVTHAYRRCKTSEANERTNGKRSGGREKEKEEQKDDEVWERFGNAEPSSKRQTSWKGTPNPTTPTDSVIMDGYASTHHQNTRETWP